jgi:hypothetical protein
MSLNLTKACNTSTKILLLEVPCAIRVRGI